MMTTRWLSVTTTDYYGRWETLGAPKPKPGEPFRNDREKSGTPLRVRWPNQTITREVLVVEHGRDSKQIDMNHHPDVFETQELFINARLRGLVIKVPLRKLRFKVLPR